MMKKQGKAYFVMSWSGMALQPKRLWSVLSSTQKKSLTVKNWLNYCRKSKEWPVSQSVWIRKTPMWSWEILMKCCGDRHLLQIISVKSNIRSLRFHFIRLTRYRRLSCIRLHLNMPSLTEMKRFGIYTVESEQFPCF